MLRFIRWLFGIKTSDELWQQCVVSEARSRGLTIERIEEDGQLVAFRLTDPAGKRLPMRVSATR